MFKIEKPKQVSQWVKYEFGDNKHVSEFKIRGIRYKPYMIATEVTQNIINKRSMGYTAANEGLSQWELQFKDVADHLIEDWRDVQVEINGEVKDAVFTKELAFDMMRYGGGDGIELWDFIVKNSARIQFEADSYKEEVLGKSENSTSGTSLEVTQKQKTPQSSKTQSTKHSE